MTSFLFDHLPSFVVAFILAFPAAVNVVLAETIGGANADWIGGVSQISAFGLVAWIDFHMFSTWLPKQQEEHAKQLEAQRQSHAAATKTIADAHAAAINEISLNFKESLKQQRIDLLALRFVCQARVEPNPLEEDNKK